MFSLVGFFGLGPTEILVLGLMCGGPLLVAGLVVGVVLFATRKKSDPEND